MEMNIPVTVDHAKYLDCIPGKFGHQLRLKGTINGEPDSVMYLPGKVWAAKKALIEAEIIGEDDFNEEPEEALGIPLEMTEFVLTNKQVAGKNYGNLEVSWKTHAKAVGATKAHNTGPLLPGEEPGYLDALSGQQSGSINTPGNHPSNAPPESQREKVERMYLESLHFVVNKVIPVWEAGKLSYDAAATNAAVAVVVIQRGGR
jgi:hypothetical protein